MDIDAKPANDEHPEANGEEVEAATSIQASEKQRALFRPVIIQSAAVLEAVKARPGKVEVCLYGGATADLDSFCARRRPKSTVGAEESLRRGRTKESLSKEARKKEPTEIGLDSAPAHIIPIEPAATAITPQSRFPPLEAFGRRPPESAAPPCAAGIRNPSHQRSSPRRPPRWQL